MTASPSEFVGRTRIRNVLDEGRVIVLENGSRWTTAAAEDRQTVRRWGEGVEVWVARDKFGEREYLLHADKERDAIAVEFAM